MKRIQIAVLVAILSGSCIASSSQAGNKAVNGLIIGAGSGAIIGQAAGQNTESVLVGSAIGGVVGYAIGSGMDDHRRVVVHHDNYGPVRSYERYRPARSHERYRPVQHHYSPAPHYYSKPMRPQYNYRGKDRYCRETIRIKEHHGRRTRVITTDCDNAYGHNNRRGNYGHH